jgi:hypothetical protein
MVLVFLSAVAISGFNGCFQYPEGPDFTLQLRDERLRGTWLLTEFTDAGGNNLISEHQNETLTVQFSRSGDRIWSEFKDGNLVNFGSYEFTYGNDYLIVFFEILNTNQTGGVQVFYTIRRLTDKELKFIDDAGNTRFYEKY